MSARIRANDGGGDRQQRHQLIAALSAWSALLGILSWGPAGHPAASLLVMSVWGVARRRSHVLMASLAYFLGSQVDLVSMPGRFYDLGVAASLLAGLAAWTVWSALGAAVIAACWCRKFPAWSLVLGLMAITIPPAGWFVMANPLHSAGWLFPGSGLAGVASTLTTAFVLARLPVPTQGSNKAILSGLAAVLVVAVAANASYHSAALPTGLKTLDTHFGRFPVGSEKNWRRAEEINDLVARALAEPQRPSVIVLPEMVVGLWSPTAAYWLQPTIQATYGNDLVILLGAVEPPSGHPVRKPRNGVVVIQHGEANWMPGRIPMPGGDWHFGEGSFEATPWLVPVIQLGRVRAAVSICYEDAVVWTHLQAALDDADVHISIASLWWSQGLPIDRRATMTAAGWARLSGVPLVRAVNW